MAPKRHIPTVKVENATIIYRNFTGREGPYNAEGERSFAVILPKDVADEMRADGWNIKETKPRDEGDEPQQFVSVSVKYGTRPPRIVTVTQRMNHRTGELEQVRTLIPEQQVEMLDYADLANVDLTINPYIWSVRGESGVKAYLKNMFITIMMDELEMKYAAIPEIEFDSQLAIASTAHEDDEIIIEEDEILGD